MPDSIFPIQSGMSIWLVAIALWTIPWKGVALWKSARKGSIKWFVALLILNTVGILEILYIFVFSKRGGNMASDSAMSALESQEENLPR